MAATVELDVGVDWPRVEIPACGVFPAPMQFARDRRHPRKQPLIDDSDDASRTRIDARIRARKSGGMSAEQTAADGGRTRRNRFPRAPHEARDQLVEEVAVGLAGSLNLRRTALRLLTMIQPRLADWAMVVVPDGRPGVLMVVGGDDAGFHDVVSRMSVEDLGLGRLLRTGRTELVHVAMDGSAAEADLATMIPHSRLVAEAATVVSRRAARSRASPHGGRRSAPWC